MSRAGDAALLAARDAALADAELPRQIDGVHRGRWLTADPISTSWEGWDAGTGSRAWLRCARPRYRSEPLLMERLSAAAAPDAPGPRAEWRPDGDWPHLRWARPGLPLAELLPIDEPLSVAERAALLGRGLEGLRWLHQRGAVLGDDPLDVLVLTEGGPRLLWRDPFGAEGSPGADLRALAARVAALPGPDDPVQALARGWADAPPPSAADGLRLLQAALSAALLDARHRLALGARHHGHRAQLARLARAVAALGRVPPPVARACLRADADGVLICVHSDGSEVRGGAARVGARPPAPGDLPRVWAPAAGLDAAPARLLMRAWADRDGGDPARRRSATAAMGGTDAAAWALLRWMSAAARLRAGGLLLQHRLRSGAPPGDLSPTI